MASESKTAVVAALIGNASLALLHLGPNAVLVFARVWFRPELTARQIEEAVLRLEDAAQRAA
jgi:hypothetical protein